MTNETILRADIPPYAVLACQVEDLGLEATFTRSKRGVKCRLFSRGDEDDMTPILVGRGGPVSRRGLEPLEAEGEALREAIRSFLRGSSDHLDELADLDQLAVELEEASL